MATPPALAEQSPTIPKRVCGRPATVAIFFLFAASCWIGWRLVFPDTPRNDAISRTGIGAISDGLHGTGITELRLSERSVVQELGVIFTDRLDALKTSFRILNDTPEIVRFLEVRPSCSCSGARLEQKELKPGDQTILHIEAVLRGRSGHHTFATQLVTQENDIYNCSVGAELHQQVEYSPPALNLGVVRMGAQVSGEALLRIFCSEANDDPKAISLHASSERLQVSTIATRIDPHGQGLLRTVSFRATLEAPRIVGPASAEVITKCDAPHGACEKRMLVYCNVQSSYVVTPPRVFFTSVIAPNADPKKRVSVRRLDGASFLIRKITTTVGDVDATIGGNGSSAPIQEVIVRRRTSDGAGDTFWGELLVHTDDALEPTLRVSFAGVP